MLILPGNITMEGLLKKIKAFPYKNGFKIYTPEEILKKGDWNNKNIATHYLFLKFLDRE